MRPNPDESWGEAGPGTAMRQGSDSFDLLRMDRQIQRRVAARQGLKAAAMLGVVAVGLRRGGSLGWAAAGLGLAALTRELRAWLEARPEWRKRAPVNVRRRIDRDPVDVASSSSFPASDAPAHELH